MANQDASSAFNGNLKAYRAPQEKDFKRSDGQGPYRSHLKSCCAYDSKKQIV